MHPRYTNMLSLLIEKLIKYADEVRALPGLEPDGALHSLAAQLVDSRRKIDRMEALPNKSLSAERAAPSSPMFDPEMAAVLAAKEGDLDEACWLCFLSVHFGRHGSDGWLLPARVYGALGATRIWHWGKISTDPTEFREWMADTLRGRNAPLGRFGNHRSRETLRADLENGTPNVLASYVEWVRSYGGHSALIEGAVRAAKGDPAKAFDDLYQSMRAVRRFGRLGRFDYLTLLGKLRLAPIAPGSTYIAEGTGPLSGARLLFTGHKDGQAAARDLERWADDLAIYLGVGMQAMEDSLCNWQKTPTKFLAFRG